MLNIIKSIFFTALSFIVILFIRFKKVNVGHFTSVKKAYKDYTDPRTHVYLNDKKAILIIRSQNFFYSFLSFIKFRKTIFFNFILNLNYLFGKCLFMKEEKINNLNIRSISKIFTILRLKEFHMIDDYRNVQLFSKICEINNIKLYIYQHGRFTKTLPVQKKLKNITFERYFVWSFFFKKKLLEINSNLNKNNIQIKKRFSKKFLPKKTVNIRKKIIIIHEKNISDSDYKLIIEKIINTKIGYEIYFKFRNNEEIEYNLSRILKNCNVKIFHKESIYNIFRKNKFDCLIGFNSTLLLEASYFNICPLMVYKAKPYLQDYLNEKVFFISNIRKLDKKITNFIKRKKEVNNFKRKLWN